LVPESRYTESRHGEEIISAGYLRGDLSLLNNKLNLVGGVRFEQTHASGDGPLRVAAADGVPSHWVVRGNHNAKDYDSWFPSMNAQYKFGNKEQFVIRASWFKSIGRPPFSIYNGTLHLPDLGSDPFSSYIQLNSGTSDLKPWTASTWRGEINYYFTKGGLFKITAFTRDYTNRHVVTIYPVTDELRAQYGIGPEYQDYFISTRTNSPYKFTLRELSMELRQKLTFLPDWARGLSVSGAATWRTKSGTEAETATGSQYASRSFKAAIAYNRRRLSARVALTFRERYVSSIYENNDNIEPGTREFGCSLTTLKAEASFKITKRFSIYAQGDNLLNKPTREYEAVSPSTPGGPQLISTNSSGVRVTFGLQGSY
jgi:TonB-dependent receptor